MDELDTLVLSVGAQMLVFDLGNGCTATRSRNGAPSVIMRLPGGPPLKTRGQVSDSVVEELSSKNLIHFFGESFPQPFKLTSLGEAYYERLQQALG